MMPGMNVDQSRRGPELPTIVSCSGKLESSIYQNIDPDRKTGHARQLVALGAVCR